MNQNGARAAAPSTVVMITDLTSSDYQEIPRIRTPHYEILHSAEIPDRVRQAMALATLKALQPGEMFVVDKCPTTASSWSSFWGRRWKRKFYTKKISKDSAEVHRVV